MTVAQRVLERLLRKGERARLRGDADPASLSMTGERDGREYRALRTLDAHEAFHGAIAMAERAGAIHVQRDRHRGEGDALLRIIVADLDVLAGHLGLPLLDARVQIAATRLEPWRAQFPVIDDVLARWRSDRKVRDHGPEAADDLADAAMAVQARRAEDYAERILRRESARLFAGRPQASKRLEKLTPWLDLLASGQLAADGLVDKSHVWALLGLRREPQPLLIAGNGTLLLDDGVELPLATRFLGVPMEAVRGVRTVARGLLSIENLASFHDATRAAGADRLLLIYTGGMPSPIWRQAYARLLASLPTSVPILHWGDIDAGGFRIAAVLAASARAAGRDLQPWCMSPRDVPEPIAAGANVPAPSTLSDMCRWAARAGWDALAEALMARPLCLEQEALTAVLPPDTATPP